MTCRMLPLYLMKHLPDLMRMRTISTMEQHDEERAKRGKLTTNRDELMAISFR